MIRVERDTVTMLYDRDEREEVRLGSLRSMEAGSETLLFVCVQLRFGCPFVGV